MALLAAALILTTLPALWRLLHGPTTADRLLCVQMLGTASIALLLLMAEWQQQDHWRDVALVLALLGAVISAALVQLLRPARRDNVRRQEKSS
ncbi:MAG: monovalent cation/H+ antiporter complex subunit F [Pseudohongiellaceae bacterium]